ncbi:Acg family FMN-binding oxidoreductase [Actinopolyspora mortivallis]|uniref:Nitroreductase n=1 Tax=Actinopolyspora mortivallis TaxID=33906 RepID=A0A2T0GVE7_ACTMO|nr:nitroreductase family protein [Actinopolyspora mortivallis]PRW63089.1 nitroreductase [Actinopolyspora mortivallis]
MTTFPSALGLSPQQCEQVLRKAAAAPSLHNRQPWRFRLLPHVIELHSRPQRRLPATDPTDRDMLLDCGAALLNLRLALAHTGTRPVVTLLPRLSEATALAEIRAEERKPPDPTESELHRAIETRRTNRRPFLDPSVPEKHRQQLIRAVRTENCWLHVVGRSEHASLEELIHRAHRKQTADPEFMEEMRRWTGLAEDVDEGVPASAAGPAPEPQDRWVVRDFSGNQAPSRVTGKDFEEEPLLVVVCSYTNSTLDALRAGQALQRMLLTATVHGLSASMISQVVEVRETREGLRELLGESLWPQLVVRLGRGGFTPATPRLEPRRLLMPPEPDGE